MCGRTYFEYLPCRGPQPHGNSKPIQNEKRVALARRSCLLIRHSTERTKIRQFFRECVIWHTRMGWPHKPKEKVHCSSDTIHLRVSKCVQPRSDTRRTAYRLSITCATHGNSLQPRRLGPPRTAFCAVLRRR